MYDMRVRERHRPSSGYVGVRPSRDGHETAGARSKGSDSRYAGKGAERRGRESFACHDREYLNNFHRSAPKWRRSGGCSRRLLSPLRRHLEERSDWRQAALTARHGG